MTLEKKELGASGEAKALEFLVEKGYEPVAKNLKLFCGEIDLLMKKGKTLVIVEVKTKSNQAFGVAVEMITPRKKKKLLALANALWQKFPNQDIRIDVVTVDNDKIKHLVSAVEEG